MNSMKSKLTYLKMPELFEEFSKHQNDFFAVVDIKVKSHLPNWIQTSDKVFWLSDPEANKTLIMYEKVIDFFLKSGIGRTSKLIAIGGSATTDLTGFVAATILRGIAWKAIPTTLLAMVDGSIGGKVAVNARAGKNLIGAFHLPEMVFLCFDFLSTLPEEEWNSGKGEVLKYGFLSKKIHDLIMADAPTEIIALECAKYKELVIENDFKEQGERVYLNFGHTLGHAFEATLKIPHGTAVAMGIKYLLEIFHSERLKDYHQLISRLKLNETDMNISSYSKFSIKDFMNFLEQDKKKIKNSIRLVLVEEIGKASILELAFTELKLKLESHAEFKN